MKKKLLKIAVILVVCVIAAALAATLFLDSIVKKGVETVGPKIAKVDITLGGVDLSMLSGKGELKKLVVGNPEGFKGEAAIRMDSITVAVNPGSLLSDTIVVRSVNIQAPEINFEGSLRGSNLGKILDNVEETTGGKDKPTETKEAEGKKILVEDLVVKGGVIRVGLAEAGGKGATVPLPEIHLTDIGTVTMGELTEKVLKVILEEAIPAATAAVTDIGKGATEQLQKTTKGIGDIFKKKE